MGTFIERVQALRDNVKKETVGTIKVDQIYAAYQHFRDDLHHPDGGKAYFLRDPLFAGESRFMERLAHDTLSDEGNGLADAMMKNMESLSQSVYDEAPWEFADLRASGHPSVRRDGEIVHDREPHVRRLSDAELAEKKRLSRLFNPDRTS